MRRDTRPLSRRNIKIPDCPLDQELAIAIARILGPEIASVDRALALQVVSKNLKKRADRNQGDLRRASMSSF